MSKLIIRLEGEERTVDLSSDLITIGRSTDCVIPVQHRSLSRRHCEIRRIGANCSVRDCGSLNGTMVNGKKIAGEHILKPGDRIDVGAAAIYFEEVPERPAPKREVEAPAGVPLVETGGLPPAYVAWSQHGTGGSIGRWTVVLVFLLVLVAGYYGYRQLSLPAGQDVERDNLLENGSFETMAAEGVPGKWVLPLVQSRVVVERQGAKHGRRALLVEKAHVPEEYILSCASGAPIEARLGEVFEISGWMRSQGLRGVAAIRCVARSVGGFILARAYSPTVQGTEGWKQVRFEFVAPRAVRHLAVECVVAGPEGRALFDGLRVIKRAGEAQPDLGKDFDLKNYYVQLWPDGTFHVMYKIGEKEGQVSRKWVLANVRLVLRTPQGTVDQSFAAGRPAVAASTRDAAGTVSCQTKLLHPVTSHWIDVRQSVEEVDGELQVLYQFIGEGLRSDDEVGVEIAGPLDPAAAARMVTEGGEQAADFSDLSAPAVRRFIWYDGEAAYTLRYPFPLALAGGRRAGALRLSQFVGVSRARKDPTNPSHPGVSAALGFGLSVTFQRQLADLEKAFAQAHEAERQDHLSEALAVYRGVADAAKEKDPSRAREAEAHIREIQSKVQSELDRARRVIMGARLIGDAESLVEGNRLLSGLARRFKDSNWAPEVSQMQGELEEFRKSIEPATDPGLQIFRLAEHHFNRGEKGLCRLFLDYFETNGKKSALANEAAELRKKLDEPAPAPGPGKGAPPGSTGSGRPPAPNGK